MKVIIRDECKLGSGTTVGVYEYDPNVDDKKQLWKLIDKESDWFEKVHIPVDEQEVWEDEACICGGDYAITYYIREVNKKPSTSFADDQEKMIDFCYMSKADFLKFYSYLTEEDYTATIHEVINRSRYWHKEWYEDNPDKDGRDLKDIVFGIMMTEWLADR